MSKDILVASFLFHAMLALEDLCRRKTVRKKSHARAGFFIWKVQSCRRDSNQLDNVASLCYGMAYNLGAFLRVTCRGPHIIQIDDTSEQQHLRSCPKRLGGPNS